MTRWQLINGDSRTELTKLADNSIDSIVTDPPYELGFMGKSWDATGIAYDVNLWRECLRVLKPGGHILAFSGSRTYHRMAVAIEDAGFEIRDQIMWVYGSGFPKSLDISKAIDKAAGAEREVIGIRTDGMSPTAMKPDKGWNANSMGSVLNVTAPATAEAKVWDGWGTALKPAHEPIVLARKPLIGTVAQNVLTHGVGGLNIDGCRIEGKVPSVPMAEWTRSGTTGATDKRNGVMSKPHNAGRWPANFIHDGSDEVLELFPDTKGGIAVRKNVGISQKSMFAFGNTGTEPDYGFGDSGSAARFFYCAKASQTDRNEGLDHLTPQREADRPHDNLSGGDNPRNQTNTPRLNHHPTVKPTTLMRYLCRLITPPNGIILDPFTGSGSTGKAAILENFQFIGIEQHPDYISIAQTRIQHTESTLP